MNGYKMPSATVKYPPAVKVATADAAAERTTLFCWWASSRHGSSAPERSLAKNQSRSRHTDKGARSATNGAIVVFPHPGDPVRRRSWPGCTSASSRGMAPGRGRLVLMERKYPLAVTYPTAESRQIAAPAEKVWALVSDLPRMGEWSPENEGGAWADGATGPAMGATFDRPEQERVPQVVDHRHSGCMRAGARVRDRRHDGAPSRGPLALRVREDAGGLPGDRVLGRRAQLPHTR